MAQIAPVLGDSGRNLACTSSRSRRPRRQQADLIVFPELSLTGYFVRDMVPDLAIARRRRKSSNCSRRPGRWRWSPVSSRNRRGTASTTPRFSAEGGSIVHVHRKVYLPTYGLFDEQRYSPPASGSRPSTRAVRPGGDPHLRRLVAPFRGGDHAGRRSRHVAVRVEFARPRRRRPDRSASPRPTSICPSRSRSCWGPWWCW